MDTTLHVLFWASTLGVVYIYAGYPPLVWCLARWRRRAVLKSYQPRTVSVVLVAHNEATNIVRKLNSLLAMDHADTIREIFVGSDGSTDGMNALVKFYGDPRVQLVAYDQRRGKPAALNDLLPRCTGEIVLLTDARQEFDRACLTELVANFADPAVGVVSGELVLRRGNNTTTAAEGIGLYWRYEKIIRKSESRWRSVPGATGCCYAIRRELFRPIPESTILDDVAIPMTIVAQGYRCLFELKAMAFDNPSQSPEQEAVRKRRTIAGAAQLMQLYPQWLLPGGHPLWWEYMSHKVLRLLSPVLLAIALETNAALAGDSLYLALFVGQTAFYTSAVWGWLCQLRGRRSRLFGVSLMFLALNLTTVRALCDAVRSRYQVTWHKAAT
jgi:biofilm PGA synthesis N-glycosyltransferase PgaC